MASGFISYRHDDSFASAKLLVEHLKRWLPEIDFFIDESGLQAGEDWRASLAARLDGAQTLLVVIGARWMEAKPGGGRRIDDADDVVRWEIERALTGKKRVIPVLVDGARLPVEADLPPTLRSLARLQYCEIGRQTFDGDIQRLARALADEGAAADPARFIWLVKRALLVVPVVSGVLLALAWSHLFDRANVWLENRIAWLGDGLLDMPLRDQLRIVALSLEPDAAREAVRLEPSRRAQFAALLDELARQGARAVVFDVTLSQESEYDGRLAESIRGAISRGVNVVFGFRAFDQATGRPRIARAIEERGRRRGRRVRRGQGRRRKQRRLRHARADPGRWRVPVAAAPGRVTDRCPSPGSVPARRRCRSRARGVPSRSR